MRIVGENKELTKLYSEKAEMEFEYRKKINQAKIDAGIAYTCDSCGLFKTVSLAKIPDDQICSDCKDKEKGREEGKKFIGATVVEFILDIYYSDQIGKMVIEKDGKKWEVVHDSDYEGYSSLHLKEVKEDGV